MSTLEQLWQDNLLWQILAQPWGWRLWILWLMVINTASVAFLRHRGARWVGVAWVGNVVTMMTLYWLVGYTRLLGLSHVIWWTPLLILLVPMLLRARPPGFYGRWLVVLTVTNLVSLAIDYVDVARYLLGDRASG